MALLFLICCVVIFGTYSLSLLIKLLRGERTKNDIIFLVCLMGMSIFFGYFLSRELNLLINHEVVIGTTQEKCYKYRSPKGVEITYDFNGETYTQCVGYGFFRTVNYPNAQYKVKVSTSNPELIRVDFSQEIKN